jgi:peptidoglycan DL-endopeptidase CwlO
VDAALNALSIRLRSRRSATVLVACAVLGGSTTSGLIARAHAEPPALSTKRAEVFALQAQLQELDARAGRIIEAYNGARYHLGVVEGQIRTNSAHLRKARADHSVAQGRLSARLVSIYREGGTSLARMLLTAGSLSEAMDDYALLRRVEGADRSVVRDLQASRERIGRARRELLANRRIVRAELATAARHRAAIEAVLTQRRALLRRSQGDLALLEATERRQQAAQFAIAQARLSRLQAQQRRIESERGDAPAAAAAGGVALPLGAGAPAGSAPAASPGIGRPDVVGYAMQLIGTPYQWGGSSPESGFDCSGFVTHVYGRFGKPLPHYTGGQWGAGSRVSREQLEPGDLVFFDGLGHDGIYVGGGQFIHSPHTGDRVKISSVDEGWYGNRYVGAVRPQ